MPNNISGTTRRNRSLRKRANNSNNNSVNRNRSRITSINTSDRLIYAAKWAIICVTLTLLIIYGFLVTGYVIDREARLARKYLISEQGLIDSIYKENYESTSDLLLGINAFNKKILHTQKEIKMFLHEDPFVEVFKKYIQPVLDKVSSIRASIQIYEKMDRTQGGPMHFIETSIQDLKNIIQNELTIIDLVGAQALDDKLVFSQRLIFDLLEDIREYLEGKATISIGVIQQFENQNIHIRPEVDPDDIDFSLITFENLIVLLDKLAWKMAEGEDLSAKIQEIYTEYNLTSLPEADELEDLLSETDMHQIMSMIYDMNDSHEEVVQEIKQNQEYYMLLMPYRQKLIDDIADSSRMLVQYETNQRTHYRNLVRGLVDDIHKLQERLNNLRHKT